MATLIYYVSTIYNEQFYLLTLVAAWAKLFGVQRTLKQLRGMKMREEKKYKSSNKSGDGGENKIMEHAL